MRRRLLRRVRYAVARWLIHGLPVSDPDYCFWCGADCDDGVLLSVAACDEHAHRYVLDPEASA